MIERIRAIFLLPKRSLRRDGEHLIRGAKLRVERSSAFLACGLPVLFMIACATAPPVDDEPAVQPIVLGPESSPPIFFEKVIFRIAAGTSMEGTTADAVNRRGAY